MTICQQPVLATFRYPTLSETTKYVDKKKNIPPPPGFEPQLKTEELETYEILMISLVLTKYFIKIFIYYTELRN